MSQINTALDGFKQALEELEQNLSHVTQQRHQLVEELKAINVTCAHLRTEVSQLKKEVKIHTRANEKATHQIDLILSEIDTVLETANG